MKINTKFVLFSILACAPVHAGQTDTYDYFAANRIMIRNGVQAILMCNGLFTSERTLAQVFRQELAYLSTRVGTANGGDYVVEHSLKAVAVGGGASGPTMRAAFRNGVGCIIMAPEQSFEDIDSLPQFDRASLDGDVAAIDWPNGDRAGNNALSSDVDPVALANSATWAFDRESEEQDTISLIVLHKGNIVLEQYADGFDITTRTRTWSTAKSIAVTLIGTLVEDRQLELDESLGIKWLPALAMPQTDPREAITLRHVLNMSSGLFPVDNNRMEYATGSGLAYWAGASSVKGASSRALVRSPGTYWDYENYDTLLAVLAMKNALGDTTTYQEFPRKALFDRIGMRNTLVSTDRFGDFIFSSQVYTNARDLARFGLLYAQDGIWDGERLLSQEWIQFVRTPAPATSDSGNFYGGQWWLVPDDRTDVPKDAFSTAGNRGQFVVVVPSYGIVIVRRGLDFGRQGFNRWELTREVLKAFPQN